MKNHWLATRAVKEKPRGYICFDGFSSPAVITSDYVGDPNVDGIFISSQGAAFMAWVKSIKVGPLQSLIELHVHEYINNNYWGRFFILDDAELVASCALSAAATVVIKCANHAGIHAKLPPSMTAKGLV